MALLSEDFCKSLLNMMQRLDRRWHFKCFDSTNVPIGRDLGGGEREAMQVMFVHPPVSFHELNK
jgi:hypothetical protein